MNKVATYLNEHLHGEAIASPAVCSDYSTGSGVLSIAPDMVVYPVDTSDVRKVARFAWQLAEKGHVLSLTPHGYGEDPSGASSGSGLLIDISKRMNRLQEMDVKQRLIRAEAGASNAAVNASLWSRGLGLPVEGGTVGGAIASDSSTRYSSKYGSMGDCASRLEIVLASGDVLQTGRLSKRELGQKKGLQTFEGEIYRSIDNLIADNLDTVSGLVGQPGKAGYPGVSHVKAKDGSIDLTPLFVGSQGTLGVISEAILKADFVSRHQTAVVMSFAQVDDARDWMDELISLSPTAAEFYDHQILQQALLQGKKFSYVKPEVIKSGAVITACFDDFSERSRSRSLKKLTKRLLSLGKDVEIHVEDGEYAYDKLSIHGCVQLAQSSDAGLSAPALLSGAYIPIERFDDFLKSLKKLALQHEVSLPVHYDILSRVLNTEPLLDLTKVTQRQKAVKLLADFSSLVYKVGGEVAGDYPEGRLKAPFVTASMDQDVAKLYQAIKQIFDPYNMLNPGVKQDADIKGLVKQMRSH